MGYLGKFCRTVPIPVISKLLNHKSLQTTARYINVNEKDMREAVKKTSLKNMGKDRKRKIRHNLDTIGESKDRFKIREKKDIPYRIS